MSQTSAGDQKYFLPRAGLEPLVGILRQRGYTVLAPTRRDEIIALAPVESADQIARGVHDHQDGGRYRLTQADPEVMFEYGPGADSPKRYLFPPELPLVELRVRGNRFIPTSQPPAIAQYAFLGIRACELAAIKVQDRVFGLEGQDTLCADAAEYYRRTRRRALLIAVNCTRPGGTCFCASMGTGPAATEGFDLSLTELRDGFLLTVGSQAGAALGAELDLRAPTSAEEGLAEMKLAAARAHMPRHLDTRGLKERLEQTIDDPNWERVAARCLSCGNCTMVCPTCFCFTVSDSSGLTDGVYGRTRRWESCFSHQFSYVAGSGPVRSTIAARYRHWLRHKLCTWQDQFGVSGCVGCGRCITWCPVGIDLTEEAQRLGRHVPGAGAVPIPKAGGTKEALP